ncbi:MAG TPA: DUF2786 domain-containing protein [Verrucomicrobiae bacterium]|nr:DUF2786 domain-containing protein [Verrucomicrobiae bacterium]
MTRDEAIGRIRRLLKLGNDAAASPAEAEQALSRAMALSRQYHVDAAALATADEVEEPIEHRRIEVGLRFSFNRKQAACICRDFFSVETVISETDLVMIGTAADLTIAEYVFEYCAATASRALSRWVGGRRLATSTRASFVEGFYTAIARGLRNARQDQAAEADAFALAVVDRGIERRRAYFKKMFPETRSVPTRSGRRNHTAAAYGYLKGREVQIRPALNGNRPAPAQLERPAQALLEL